MKRYVKFLACSVYVFLMIALSSYYFIDISPAYEFDDGLGYYIYMADQDIHHISEGDGYTYIKRNGVVFDEYDERRSTICIWGDSYVEAFNVDDGYKMGSVLSVVLDGVYNVVSIGSSGRSVADYYYLIDGYQKRFNDVRYNVIVLGQIDDFLPNQRNANWSRFEYTDSNGFELKKTERVVAGQEYKYLLNNMKVQFVWELLKSVKGLGGKNIPVPHLGALKKESTEVAVVEYNKREAFTYALKNLTEVSEGKLVLVYLPEVPRIENNSVVYADKRTEDAALLEEVCGSFHVPFINMQRDFNDLFKEKNVFPRGFANSSPSEGHLNEVGHDLVGNSIASHIN